MRATRKMQFAVELLGEAAEEIESDEYAEMVENHAESIDSLRGEVHMDEASRSVATKT